VKNGNFKNKIFESFRTKSSDSHQELKIPEVLKIQEEFS